MGMKAMHRVLLAFSQLRREMSSDDTEYLNVLCYSMDANTEIKVLGGTC